MPASRPAEAFDAASETGPFRNRLSPAEEFFPLRASGSRVPAARPSLAAQTMIRFLHAIRPVLDAYFKILQVLVTVLVGLMIVPVTLQIFSRYTGFIPRYIWTEEAARFCFIWIILLGATIAVREGTHFEVDVLPTPRTARGQAALCLIVYAFMLLFTMVFVANGYAYALFGYHQTSELTGINMVFIHGVYLLAGISWTLFIGERVLWALAVLLSGKPEAVAHLRGDHHGAR
jgi:TRAP-type transport system small permease protein